VFFTGIDGAKFRKPVVPGDQLRLELKKDKTAQISFSI
jgi:3-hydroxyacyl-[acyl-carrier-protein] dehydratase